MLMHSTKINSTTCGGSNPYIVVSKVVMDWGTVRDGDPILVNAQGRRLGGEQIYS